MGDPSDIAKKYIEGIKADESRARADKAQADSDKAQRKAVNKEMSKAGYRWDPKGGGGSYNDGYNGGYVKK